MQPGKGLLKDSGEIRTQKSPVSKSYAQESRLHHHHHHYRSRLRLRSHCVRPCTPNNRQSLPQPAPSAETQQSTLPARVDVVLADASSEEPFAAIAARGSIMLPSGAVPTDGANGADAAGKQAGIG